MTPARKLFCVLLLLSCSICNAQFTQTDEFDFWEDQGSHNYSVSGTTSHGAYVCSGDNSLRLSNCALGSGSVTIDVAVNPLCDSIRLDFLVAWGGTTPVHADTVYAGIIPSTASCNTASIIIPNASSISADGFISLTITDTINGCSGDIQLSRVKVYSTQGFTTGISANDESGHPAVFPNPSAGLFSVSAQDIRIVKNIRVVNSSGQIVFTEDKYPRAGTVDIRDQPAGIYFVLIYTDRGTISQKLILQK